MAEKNPFPGENNTGHFWDDNLRELRNPAPRWWMIAFWASVIWWVAYGILYPMWPLPHGYTHGILGWTSMKEYHEGLKQVEQVRGKYENEIRKMTPEQILANPGLTQYTLASAKVLFGDNCAPCHGSGGQGNPGYPVLADNDWLYGGSLGKIQESITNGRKGAMPSFKGVLTDSEIDTMAKFVVALSKGKPGSKEGWELFKGKGGCVACHGPKANGIIAELPNGQTVTVGAANLTDRIWRFEPGGYASAKHTITYGVNQPGVAETRNAVMPTWGGPNGKLTPAEIKKLVVYVYKLSH
jgi:cytochrome c oxidase cbb3-type subunit III